MASHAPATYIVRDGDRLVMTVAPGQVAQLPPLCVKCGAPANGKPVNKIFSWHHPALYLLVLLGLVVYVIVAAIVRKSMRLSVPLCAHHAQRRSTAVTLAWVIPLVGVADAFILPRFGVDGGLIALIAITFLATGVMIWAIVDYPIRPKSLIDTVELSADFVRHIYSSSLPAGSRRANAVNLPLTRDRATF